MYKYTAAKGPSPFVLALTLPKPLTINYPPSPPFLTSPENSDSDDSDVALPNRYGRDVDIRYYHIF